MRSNFFVTHQRSCDKGSEDVTGSVNYGSKHATVQNELLRSNAYKFIVFLAEVIRVPICSVRGSLLPLEHTEAQMRLLELHRTILWKKHQL